MGLGLGMEVGEGERRDVGFRLVGADGNNQVASISFIDSTFSNINTSAIIVKAPSEAPGAGDAGLVLDNVRLDGNIADHTGKQLLAAGYHRNVSRSHCRIA